MSHKWLAVLLALSAAACSKPPALADAREWFTDQSEATGLHFVHVNGMTGKYDYPEIIGAGVGLLDYDHDGDLDVFLVQGQALDGGAAPAGAHGGRLFRNNLHVRADGTRTMTFTDVTEASGIVTRGYGMGVATGDFNNDGCVDLYVTNLGANQLFKNNCDGTFSDVSKASGTDDAGWSVSASFLDFDRDGWLDLFVANYVSYSVETDVRCFMIAGGPNYCPPQVYRAQPSKLFHNNRDGTFTDVTARSGMAVEFGPALGVSTADFNGDGWIDIYVANDGQPNQLWINQHDGTFRDTGVASGTGLGEGGEAKSSMGVDAADFDNDGDEDLVVTELTGQGTDLYVNDGSGAFEDASARAGVRFASLTRTGFGAAWLDVDNDGWLDILSVNGAVTRDPQRPNEPFSLQQKKQLLRNLGNGRFEDVTARAGTVFQRSEVGRGAAFGDLDNDGDTDVVVSNNSGPARLLVNEIGSRNHWIGMRLVGTAPQRDMIGARVSVTRKDGSTFVRRARSDGSYASANNPRVLIGLGQSSDVSEVRITWPSGRVETVGPPALDRYTTITEGGGR